MGRLIAVAIVALALGAGAVLLIGSGDEPDRSIAPISVGSTSSQAPKVVVDDGVPTSEAEPVARAAAEHVRGRALSVDLDDGRYEVEVQRPDGAIVEVLLDGRSVIGVESGEGDSVAGD